jgi:diacylglycerol kinase (ATP)
MTKYKIIANPNSGHGKGAQAIPEIEQELTRLGLDYDLVRTERVGHAIQLAHAAAVEGVEVVVAAGGDGTVNEVLNGLMEARGESKNRPALGILSTGRGNDFAPCLDIPKELPAAFEVLKSDQRRRIDIGRVSGGKFPQGRYFANNVGVGFDAIGTIEVAKMPEWGMLSFMIAILKTIFLFYKGPTVRLDYDEQSLTTSTLMLLTMNGKRMGTGDRPPGQPLADIWPDPAFHERHTGQPARGADSASCQGIHQRSGRCAPGPKRWRDHLRGGEAAGY